MKLTKSKLKKIIKEELQNILLNEDDEKRTQYLCINWYDQDLSKKERRKIDRQFQDSNKGKHRNDVPSDVWNNYLHVFQDCPHRPPKVTVHTVKTPPKE